MFKDEVTKWSFGTMGEHPAEDDREVAVRAREAEGWPAHALRAALDAAPHEADLVLEAFDAQCTRLMHLNERIASVDEALAMRAPPPAPAARQDLVRIEELEAQWAAWSAIHRPHGPLAEAAEDAWRSADRSDELRDFVRRLDRLDPALAVEVHVVQRLLRDPGHRVELRAGIERAEAEQVRQQRALAMAADRLREEGIPVPDLHGLLLMDGYDLVDRWTRHADDLHRLRLRIERDLRPFDATVADALLNDVARAAETTDEGAIAQVSEEIGRHVVGFQRRLDELNGTLDGWRAEGYRLPTPDRIAAEDLLDWEANLADIERMKTRHGHAWRRLKELAPIVGAEAEPALALAGDLTATEAFIDHVDALHASWGQASAQALNILEAWDIEGMDTAAWHSMVEHDPSSALALIEARMPLVHRAIDVRRRLHALDLSIEGEEDRTRLDALLRGEHVNEEQVADAEVWIAKMERRTERHMRLILDEWTMLRREGWTTDASPPPGLSLRAAEEAVSALRRGTRGRSDRASSSGRILARLEDELLAWHAQGWDVEDLLDAARANPMDVGLRISSLRSAVLGHRRLVRRLEALPWERDVDLGNEVLRRMRRPQDLEHLASDIPGLARRLAASPPDPSAPTWRAWTPNAARTPVDDEDGLSPADEQPAPPTDAAPTSKDQAEAPAEADRSTGGHEEHETKPEPATDVAAPMAEASGVVAALPGRADEVPWAPSSTEPESNDGHEDEVEEALADQIDVDEATVEHDDLDDGSMAVEGSDDVDDGSTKGTPAPRVTGDGEGAVTPSEKVLDDDVDLDVEPQAISRPNTATRDVPNGTTDLRPVLTDLVQSLGLEMPNPADTGSLRRLLAPHANTAPRDLRVGRLLRLVLRLLPEDLAFGREEQRAMLERLVSMTHDLNAWTTLRLRGRNLSSDRGLLKDAETLGSALERIPGPGHPLPLGTDEEDLPSPAHLEALRHEVDLLHRAVRLPAAGGVR